MIRQYQFAQNDGNNFQFAQDDGNDFQFALEDGRQLATICGRAMAMICGLRRTRHFPGNLLSDRCCA